MSKLNIQQKVGTYMETHGKDLNRGQSRDVKLSNEEIYAQQKGDLTEEQRDQIKHWVHEHRGFKESFIYATYKKNDWNEVIVRGILNQVIDNNKNNQDGDWATAGKKNARENSPQEKTTQSFRKESRGKHYQDREYSNKNKSRKYSSNTAGRDESDDGDQRDSSNYDNKYKQEETQRSFRKSRVNNDEDSYARNEQRIPYYKKQNSGRSPQSPRGEGSSQFEKGQKPSNRQDNKFDTENVYVAQNSNQASYSSNSGLNNSNSNSNTYPGTSYYVKKSKDTSNQNGNNTHSTHSNNNINSSGQTEISYIPKVQKDQASEKAPTTKSDTSTFNNNNTNTNSSNNKDTNNSVRKASNASSDRSETALGGSQPYEEAHTAVEEPVQPLKNKNERNIIKNDKSNTGPIGTNSHHGSNKKPEPEVTTISRAQPKDNHSKDQEFVKKGADSVGVPNKNSPAATHPTPVVAPNQTTTQTKQFEPPSIQKEISVPITGSSSNEAAPVNITNVGLTFTPNTVNPPPLFSQPAPNISVCIYLKDNNTQQTWGHVAIQLQLDAPNLSGIGLPGIVPTGSSAFRKEHQNFS